MSGGGVLPDKALNRDSVQVFLSHLSGPLTRAADKHGVDRDALAALSLIESYVFGFDRAKDIESYCGAIGPWQVMPKVPKMTSECPYFDSGLTFPNRPTSEELLNLELNADTAAFLLKKEVDRHGSYEQAFIYYYGNSENRATLTYSRMVTEIMRTLKNSH